jgi:hypothetical protein
MLPAALYCTPGPGVHSRETPEVMEKTDGNKQEPAVVAAQYRIVTSAPNAEQVVYELDKCKSHR